MDKYYSEYMSTKHYTFQERELAKLLDRIWSNKRHIIEDKDFKKLEEIANRSITDNINIK